MNNSLYFPNIFLIFFQDNHHMLRNTEWVSRLFFDCSISTFCQHSDFTALWLGALWYFINNHFLGNFVAPNHHNNDLREYQCCPWDSHFWFYDSNLRPVRYTLPSSSHPAGFVTRGPEMQHLERRLQNARTTTNSRNCTSSSLRV